MSLPATDSPLDQLPAPLTIHERMGSLYVELALLRRLLRLCQAVSQRRQDKEIARHEHRNGQSEGGGR
jgi:hypothetical protein